MVVMKMWSVRAERNGAKEWVRKNVKNLRADEADKKVTRRKYHETEELVLRLRGTAEHDFEGVMVRQRLPAVRRSVSPPLLFVLCEASIIAPGLFGELTSHLHGDVCFLEVLFPGLPCRHAGCAYPTVQVDLPRLPCKRITSRVANLPRGGKFT